MMRSIFEFQFQRIWGTLYLWEFTDSRSEKLAKNKSFKESKAFAVNQWSIENTMVDGLVLNTILYYLIHWGVWQAIVCKAIKMRCHLEVAAARNRQSAGVSVGMLQDGFDMLRDGDYQGET